MVHDFARKWVNLLGACESSLTKLNGGINSSVYSCRSDNTTWIIKGYSSFQSGEFDRMRAEINFLNYSSQVAPHYIPQLIDFDLSSRCIILETSMVYPFLLSTHLPGLIYLMRLVSSPPLTKISTLLQTI